MVLYTEIEFLTNVDTKIAQKALRRKSWAEALDLWRQVLSVNPGSAEARASLYICLRRMSGLPDAEYTLKEEPSFYPECVFVSAKHKFEVDSGNIIKSPGDWISFRSGCEARRVESSMLDKDDRAGNLGIYQHVLPLLDEDKTYCWELLEKIGFIEREVTFYSEYAEELSALDSKASLTADAIFRLSDTYHSIFMRLLPNIAKPEPSLQTAGEMAEKIFAICSLTRKSNRISEVSPNSISFDPDSFRHLMTERPPALEGLPFNIRSVDSVLRSIQDELNEMPLVPCHNDLSFGNMLADVDGDEVHLRIIDWDGFGMNRLGVDLRGFLEVDEDFLGTFFTRLVNSLEQKLNRSGFAVGKRELILSAFMAQFSFQSKIFLRTGDQSAAASAGRLLQGMLRFYCRKSESSLS